MKYVISVSKAYLNRGKHRHRYKTKKYWHIFFYDESFSLHTKRVNWLQALYYKTQKRHRFTRVCTECGRIWYFLARSKKNIKCPQCDI